LDLVGCCHDGKCHVQRRKRRAIGVLCLLF
jgi:hypothetical protein